MANTNNWGGARQGAGRPRILNKADRTMKSMRASDEEWEIIKRFAHHLKRADKDKCIAFVDELDTKSSN